MSISKRSRSGLWLTLILSVIGAIGTGRFLLVPVELRSTQLEIIWHMFPYVLFILVLLVLLWEKSDGGASTNDKYDDRED